MIKNKIDNEFNELVEFVKSKNKEQMINVIKNNFEYRRSHNILEYSAITRFYNEHSNLWGKIDISSDKLELIENNASALVEHIDDYKWLYQNLQDYRSKKILVAVLYYWLWMDFKKVEQIKDENYEQYFDLDLIKCDENEVFVDVGGFVGDSMYNYCQNYGSDCYSKMYCYEISQKNIEYIKKNVAIFKMKNIEIIKKGVSDKVGTMYMENDEKSSSVNVLSNFGDEEIETTSIDKDISGKVTFIKMDIEGGEEKAIVGCKKKIKEYHPKLAISVYHHNEHLYKIAKIINSYDSRYKFYLRYYGGKLLPTEYILYAV